jgi:hypothetical protein
MKKHRREHGKQRRGWGEDRRASEQAYFEPRHDAELKYHLVQTTRVLQTELPLKEKDQQVQRDQKIGYERRAVARLVVAKRKHSEFLIDISDQMARAI